MSRPVTRTNAAKTRKGDDACLSAALARLGSAIHPHENPDGVAVDTRRATAAGRTGESWSPAWSGTHWIRATFRLLMLRGFTTHEAGNLVAYLAGLHATESGWAPAQIEHVLILRSLVDCHRLPS